MCHVTQKGERAFNNRETEAEKEVGRGGDSMDRDGRSDR